MLTLLNQSLFTSPDIAIENTKRELEVLSEKERHTAIEAASKQVETQMKEENEQAVRMAVEQAKVK